MNKLFCVVIFVLFISVRSPCSEDYALFHSIEEVINFETVQISTTDFSDYEQLANHYASRGESFLICENFEEALKDFQQSCNFGLKVYDTDMSRVLVFRALFDQALAYGNLNQVEEVHAIAQELRQLMYSIQCSDCKKSQHMQETYSTLTTLPIMLCGDVPIYGPDRVSTADCIEFAQGTARKARYLISLVPKLEARVVLSILIDDLESAAINCCKVGGVWKACLQPLVNKWHQWNEKWKVFGIPPDPAW